MFNLTANERAALEPCGLAVFEDRIIYKAQPPIDDAALAAIADKCSGPLPGGLVALWRVAFGGALDYDLRVSFEEHEAVASFSELFWPGSNGYRDLWGWIEHEEELGSRLKPHDVFRR